ncbi:hypothetical protein ACJJTC_013683, partial [Scirpophaga incertulas]
MYSVRLQQVFFVCDKIITRTLRNTRFEKVPPNPGLNRRIRAFKEEGIQVDDDSEEFIESSVSDFNNVRDAYREHVKDITSSQHNLRHHIVKEKYFNENMPNLLTWSEKEQILHLAMTQPDQWSPERIAESFPVTAQIAKKLIKYSWKPATLQRIARHDASVLRNWKELKEGFIDIPNDLREHFLKFSERKIPPLSKDSVKIDLSHEKKMGEFAQIVQRCAVKENQCGKAESQLHLNNSEEPNNEPSTLIHRNVPIQLKNKRITLSQLTNNIQNSLDKGDSVDINDEIIIQNIHDNDSKTEVTRDTGDMDLSKKINSDSQELVKCEENKNNSNTLTDYPERIRIPKKLYKKDATYKVNDCYYDHDGKFLYRVLGM